MTTPRTRNTHADDQTDGLSYTIDELIAEGVAHSVQTLPDSELIFDAEEQQIVADYLSSFVGDDNKLSHLELHDAVDDPDFEILLAPPDYNLDLHPINYTPPFLQERDLLFTKFFAMFGDTPEAYYARSCDAGNLIENENLIIGDFKNEEFKLQQLDAILAQWSQAFEDYKIPMKDFRAVSPLIYWESREGRTTGLRLNEAFFDLPKPEQLRIIRGGSAVVLQYNALQAMNAEQDEVKKLFYEGCVALYAGNTDKAKLCWSAFLTLTAGAVDEVTLGLYEFASQNLRQLELIYLQYMRQQTETIYAERMSFSDDLDNERWRQNSLALFDVLEADLRAGVANTLVEAMDFERFKYEQAQQNLDIGYVRIEKGWVMREPFPIPEMYSPEFERWRIASEQYLEFGEIPDPTVMANVNLPLVHLAGGAVDYSRALPMFVPLIIRVEIGPEGGAIVLNNGVYRFPPAATTRVVALDTGHLLAGSLQKGIDYQFEEAGTAVVPDIFSGGPEKQDPVVEALLAVNMPEAWQITAEPDGKIWQGVALARVIADQGSFATASNICSEILSEEFNAVAKHVNSEFVQEIITEWNSTTKTDEITTALTQNLQTAKDEHAEQFLQTYPTGWPSTEEFAELLEQQRTAAIAYRVGILVWDMMAREVSAGVLNLSPAKLAAFHLFDSLIGTRDDLMFPSEQTVARWGHIAKEDAKWFLPSLVIGFGFGTMTRIGLRAIPFIAEEVALGGGRAVLATVAIYSASSLVEGAATDVACFVWSGGADPIRTTDIMYFSALSLAFHGSAVATGRVGQAVGHGASDIERMAAGFERYSAQGKMLALTLATQATVMTGVGSYFDEDPHLLNEGSLFEDWMINFARAGFTTAFTLGIDVAGKKVSGLSLLEMERRSLLRAQHAQMSYRLLTREYPDLSPSLRARSAVIESQYVVPLTWMPVQPRLTAEQIIEMRKAGLAVLIDRWNSNAGTSVKGFLANVDELTATQEELETMAQNGGSRADALRLLTVLDSLSVMTLAQAKGVATNDGQDPQMGHSAAVDAAYEEKRRHQAILDATDMSLIESLLQTFRVAKEKKQLFSVAFLMDLTQANGVSKRAASNLKMALSLLARGIFEKSPLNYSAKLGDTPGDSSVSNHVILHLLLDSVDRVPSFMRDLPTLLRDMVVKQTQTVADLKVGIAKAKAACDSALKTYGKESPEYSRAKTDYDVAVGTLEQIQMLLQNFCITARGDLEVHGEGNKWFPLSAFELELNGSIEKLNMDVIYEAGQASYVHSEVHRARNAAIAKVEYRYSENNGRRGLSYEQRLMGADEALEPDVKLRFLFPEGRYLNLDDISQNLLRLIGNSIARNQGTLNPESVGAQVDLSYIRGTLILRALQVQGVGRATPQEIHTALTRASETLTQYPGSTQLQQREAARAFELQKLGLDYAMAQQQGKIWYEALILDLVPRIVVDGQNKVKGQQDVELSALYEHFRYADLSSDAKDAVGQLMAVFHGPLTPEAIVFYRSMGGVVEPGRTLRYIYSGSGPNGELGLFAQIDQLRRRLEENPNVPLSRDDLLLLQRLARMSRVSVGFCRDAAYDTRDRVTRPWALFSRATLKTTQGFYRALDASGKLEADAKVGLYLFGLEISHAKDREIKVPWDDHFFFDPSMVPIRRLNESVALELSARRGAKVVCESYAMGDEMVPAFVMQDGSGRTIPQAEIVQVYREILARDFPQEFQYSYKVTTTFGDEAKRQPNVVTRCKLFYLDTPKGKFLFAQSKTNPNEYYVVGGPGVIPASKTNPFRIVTFQEILNPANFGYSVDMAPTDGSSVLRPYMGKLEVRIASTEVHFTREEMLSDTPLSEQQNLITLLDELAIGLMGYDDTIKESNNPTVGAHALPASYLAPILHPLGNDAARVPAYSPPAP